MVAYHLSACCVAHGLSDSCSCMLCCKDGVGVEIPMFGALLGDILMCGVCLAFTFDISIRGSF